jgi:uncharacterized protein (TIGR02284 family)
MNTEKAIENLNALLSINNDRIEGYKSALYEAKEADIKIMFSTLAQTSLDCTKELIYELKKLGGKKNNEYRETGKFFSIWIVMKKAIKKDDRKTILDMCKHDENLVLEKYQKILNQGVYRISPTEQSVLNKQYNLLKSDYERVNKMHQHLFFG